MSFLKKFVQKLYLHTEPYLLKDAHFPNLICLFPIFGYPLQS